MLHTHTHTHTHTHDSQVSLPRPFTNEDITVDLRYASTSARMCDIKYLTVWCQNSQVHLSRIEIPESTFIRITSTHPPTHTLIYTHMCTRTHMYSHSCACRLAFNHTHTHMCTCTLTLTYIEQNLYSHVIDSPYSQLIQSCCYYIIFLTDR